MMVARWACVLLLPVVLTGGCGPRIYVTPRPDGSFASGPVYGAAPAPRQVRLEGDDAVRANFAADIAAVNAGCARTSVTPVARERGRMAQGRVAYWIRVCGRMQLWVLVDDGWALTGQR